MILLNLPGRFFNSLFADRTAFMKNVTKAPVSRFIQTMAREDGYWTSKRGVCGAQNDHQSSILCGGKRPDDYPLLVPKNRRRASSRPHLPEITLFRFVHMDTRGALRRPMMSYERPCSHYEPAKISSRLPFEPVYPPLLYCIGTRVGAIFLCSTFPHYPPVYYPGKHSAAGHRWCVGGFL